MGWILFIGLVILAIFWRIQKGNRKTFEYLSGQLSQLEERISRIEAALRRARRAEAAVPEAAHERPVSAVPEEKEPPAAAEEHVAEPLIVPPVVEEPEPTKEVIVKAPPAAPIPAVIKTAPAPRAAERHVPLEPPESAELPTEPARRGLLADFFAAVSKKMPRRGMSLAEWETLVGGNLLNKLGMIVFVVGVALLLGYSLRYFGPIGKIATGAATGATLIMVGLILERRQRYALFAKPVIGGGWAILYFTAYASYNVEAAKIIDQPMVALLVMAAVATGMIVHSFRYRAQVVTSLAYGLAYLAIVISPLTGFSLVAIALLAASLIGVMRFLPWYHLALVAEAGTYVSHFAWMAQGTGEPTTAALWFNESILVFYWLVFTALLFLSRKNGERGERTLLAISVGNTAGFLILAGWTIWASVPNNIYFLAGGTAVAYAAVSYLLHSTGRQPLFLFNSTMAVLLAAATLPLALRAMPSPDWEWLALYWSAEAGIVVALGFRLRQIVLRIESYALCLLSLVAILAINLGGPTEGRHLLVWLTVLPVIAFFFYLFERLKKAAGREDVRQEARPLAIVMGYAATILIALLLWWEVPNEVVGLAWLGLGLVFFEVGFHTKRPHVRGQGYLLSTLAAIAFVSVNLIAQVGADQARLDWSSWLLVTPGIIGLYFLFWRMFRVSNQEVLTTQEKNAFDAPSVAATVLLAMLLWKELPAELVGLGWLVAGLALFEVGRRVTRTALRYQGYGLAAIAAGALFLIDLYGFYGPAADEMVAGRWLIVLPAVAIFYYLYWRLLQDRGLGALSTHEAKSVDLPSYVATALLAVLLWRELPSVGIALAWGTLGLILFEIGTVAPMQALRLQGHVLFGAVFVRLFMANFTSTTDTFGISHRMITVVPIIAMIYYLVWRVRELAATDQRANFERRLDIIYSYAGAILLVVLARFEFGRAYAVIAWAPLMLLFLALGVLRNDRHLRYQSYILAIIAFARSWATNMYLTGSYYGIPERYATMVPMVAAFLAAALFCIKKRGSYIDVEQRQQTKSRLGRSLNFIDAHSQTLFSLLGPALVAILLFHEVSGNMLTMAWSIEAFVVLVLGFVLVERSFRLFGLGLLAVCLIKLVAVDLEGVETIYRIGSYIVLGLLLLLVSFAYTRFRDTIKRYL
ncbi:MAG: DUF2339 domain-containing protein [Betaproteobacteria bacterium]|nr:MAG: DUF2339 domain-containing protein [Betaproteobacteria bacterium]